MRAVPAIRLPPAIGLLTVRALLSDIEAAIRDPARKVVMIEGGDGVFCRGLDFLSVDAAGDDASVRDAVQAFAETLALLKHSSKPTLALIDGVAHGGGVGLAAACDFAVATARSSFALPETLLGLIPGIIGPYLLDRLTPHRFKHWAMRGDAQDASAAVAAGLIDEIVPPAGLEGAARRWVRKLERLRPETLGALKAFVGEATRDREAARERGVAMLTAALRDPQLMKALRAFEETGRPPWEEE
jgi:enoyl-CoA hydratase/carnithine racemase